MIPKQMHDYLSQCLPDHVWDTRLQKQGPHCYLEFGPLDVDRLQRLGIKVDRLGPRLLACMWNDESPLQIGGYLVVDNLAMGAPSMGGTRMLPNISPDIIHNLARGMTLKNAAADLPFGGGKSGIVSPGNISRDDRHEIIKGFGRLLARYTGIYIPGPDVGTNDADMKTFAIENGLNNVVSKPADMGGNRIDELGGAANGVVVATKALLKHLPKLRQFPQFKDMQIPAPRDLDILIQGFGAVGAHVARIFHDYDPDSCPIISGISDATGYLYNINGLPWQELFEMWKSRGTVTQHYFHDRIMHQCRQEDDYTIFSNSADNLLTHSAFCLVPASPVFNYLDVDTNTSPSMTVDRMGRWQIIVEGANTYSPNSGRKAERRRMERHVYRDSGTLIATDYLVNSGGVIYAAHERIIPTPQHLLLPRDCLGDEKKSNAWLIEHEQEFAALSEKRRRAAIAKLETVIRRNMEELIDGLCRDHDSLPCEIAEQISVTRIASMEKSRKARDVMVRPPTIEVDKDISQAAQLLVDTDSPMVCVVSEKGKLIGIVTNWDITRAMAMQTSMDSPLAEIMTADVITAMPDATIIDCIRILENYEISAMPIVEDTRAIGIISGDILARNTLYRLLQTMI